MLFFSVLFFFFFNDTATTEIYTLSLHDALPTSTQAGSAPNGSRKVTPTTPEVRSARSSRSTPSASAGSIWAGTMPTAPAPATAATSSGVVTPPIGACCNGSRQPSSSVNGVVSIGGSSRSCQRGVAEQQALAAEPGEVDLGHGPLA